MKNFFDKPIFDPKNQMWLELLKYTIIGVTILLILGGFVVSVELSWQLNIFRRLEFDLGLFFLYFIGTLIFTTIFYISGMVFLNLLYNIHEIQINTSKNN